MIKGRLVVGLSLNFLMSTMQLPSFQVEPDLEKGIWLSPLNKIIGGLYYILTVFLGSIRKEPRE